MGIGPVFGPKGGNVYCFCLFSLGLCLAVPQLHASNFQGGPDGFGYYWESTQDRGDTIRFSWLDPSSHEILTGWTPNPDDGWKRIGLPYRFPFYGDTLDSIVTCSNGFLEFPVTYTNYENAPLPASRFPYLLALYWDDLSPAQSGSVREYDDPAQRFTCITWFNVVRFNTHETLSAQILLYADGDIRMNVLRAPQTKNSSTVGIQGQYGSNDHYLQYGCDGNPGEHQPEDSTSIRFYVRRLGHDVGVFHGGMPCGWIPTGSQTPVTGVFKNYGLSTETFPVSCCVIRTRVPRDTVFTRTQTVSNLAPGDTVECYFGDWLVPPTPDSWHVLLKTSLDGDMLPRNDTGRVTTTSFPPELGAILGSWDFEEIGSGMNLAGITYRPDSNRFYLTASEPNRVFSFSACSTEPVLKPETFQLQDFFGDDIVWGVAWDGTEPGFWITHVSAYGPGCVAARYLPDGSFSGDTWNLLAVEPNAWFAGLDAGWSGTVFATAVGGDNHILELDLHNHQLIRTLASSASSYRACSFLGDHRSYLFTGGWNQGTLAELDFGGEVVRTAPLADLADLDIYRPLHPCPDSFVWAYATTNRTENTIYKVSLGRTWSAVGLEDARADFVPPTRVELRPDILRPGQRFELSGLPPQARVCLWDAAGRLLNQAIVPASNLAQASLNWSASDRHGRNLASGIYLLTVTGRDTKLSQKLVVTP
jgi:hypothetical protein